MAGVVPGPVQAAISYLARSTSGPAATGDVPAALDDIVTQVNGIGLTPTTAKPSRNSNNAMRALLGVGTHAGLVVDGLGVGSVQGISRRVTVGPIVCESGPVVMLSSLEIRGGTASGALLLVKAGAKVVVSDCIFTSRAPVTVVLVEDGGKLLMEGCVFTGMGTTTSKVVHHNVATPASAVATMCFNRTGNTFHDAANVTATHILT